MNAIRWVAVCLCAALMAPPVAATVLYKSVLANGVIQFSDQPPDDPSRIVETRVIGASATPISALTPVAQMIDASDIDIDRSVMYAYAQVDFAEHALALARHSMWPAFDGLHIAIARLTPVDQERVEFYKRGVLDARRMLMETLQSKTAR
jgi:Domain of unknown function (DUF4124)